MKRLRDLRKACKKTQQNMADLLGISQQAYATYELDTRTPPTEMLKQLADYFGVTTDYLLERTDDPQGTTANWDQPPQLNGVYYRLAKEAQELGLPPEDIEHIIELYRKYKIQDK